MFGITTFIRQDYIIFGDQAMMLIMLIMFVVGDLIQRFLKYLADIKIRRIGWRGLWVTKQIEGTVDDDVAAKLAIGEGRQADLEQERLELQALNSERFRHRFLERNRPWILQHLVELLTPESLETIGPDGRPVVEYIRDVYAELMAMGEGARRPGDRSDISSDDDEDAAGPARQWPREPLEGASLAIARLWLAKARKRRAFWKLITGIIDANKVSVRILPSTCSKSLFLLLLLTLNDSLPSLSTSILGGLLCDMQEVHRHGRTHACEPCHQRRRRRVRDRPAHIGV